MQRHDRNRPARGETNLKNEPLEYIAMKLFWLFLIFMWLICPDKV
jgi:hypothetical protein